MVEIRVPLSIPEVGESEIAAASDVIRRRWLTMGDQTEAFEAEFAALVGVEHAIATSSGTAALHLTLVSLGVGPGDEVLVPSYSFVATANVVCYCRATPVFVEITSADDLNLSVDDAISKLSPRTKGIVAVHHSGWAADLCRLRDLADENQLFYVEDAAHAAGASRDGISCGASGDAGCFSFYSTKNVTTGEGGMITTSDAELAVRAWWRSGCLFRFPR